MKLPTGIVPVIQTPFDAAGAIDEKSLERLVDDAVRAGVGGVLAPAVASEVAYLTSAERERVVRRVSSCVEGKVPFVVGASDPDPTICIRMAQQGARCGATAFLVAVPDLLYGNEAGVLDYFGQVAAGCPLPLIVQDLQWSGPGLEVETIARLREKVGSVIGIKIETLPAGPKYSAVRSALGDDFLIAGGWAVTQMIEALDRNVDAMIPEGSMLRVYVAISRLYAAGDRLRARELFTALLPVLTFTNQTLATSVAFFKRLLVRRKIFECENMRMPGFAWDRYNARIAEESIDIYFRLEKAARAIDRGI